MVLRQLDAHSNSEANLAVSGPFDLAPGAAKTVKNFVLKLPKESHPLRDNRFMAAVLLEKPGSLLRAFDFAYIKAALPGETEKKKEPSKVKKKKNSVS